MGAMLTRVLSVSLCLRGPDSLPGSRAMLLLCLVPWVAISACGYLLLWPAEPAFAVTAVALDLLLLFAYSRFVLWIYEKPERWPQTLVSLVGVQALINLLHLPQVYLASVREQPGIVLEAMGYGFLAWWLLAMGNILSEAAGRRLWVGLALAFGRLLLYLLIFASLLQSFGLSPETP